MGEQGKYVVIVRRGEPALFQSLVEHFGIGPDATPVIWDRRIRDRRVIIQEREPERRRGERRALVDATRWNGRGFVVIRVDRLAADGREPLTGRRASAASRPRSPRKRRDQGGLSG